MNTLYNQVEKLIEESNYNEATNMVAKEFDFKLNILDVAFKSMDWDRDGQKRNVFKCELKRDNKKYVFDFGSSVIDSCEPSEILKKDTLQPTDLIEVWAGVKLEGMKITTYLSFKVPFKNIYELDDMFIQGKADELESKTIKEIADKNAAWRKSYKEGKISRAYWEKRAGINLKSGAYLQVILNAVKRATDNLNTETITVYQNAKKETVSPSLYDVLTCLQKYEVGSFEDFCSEFGYDTDSRNALKTYKAVLKEYKGMSNLFSNDELEILSLIQ